MFSSFIATQQLLYYPLLNPHPLPHKLLDIFTQILNCLIPFLIISPFVLLLPKYQHTHNNLTLLFFPAKSSLNWFSFCHVSLRSKALKDLSYPLIQFLSDSQGLHGLRPGVWKKSVICLQSLHPFSSK